MDEALTIDFLSLAHRQPTTTYARSSKFRNRGRAGYSSKERDVEEKERHELGLGEIKTDRSSRETRSRWDLEKEDHDDGEKERSKRKKPKADSSRSDAVGQRPSRGAGRSFNQVPSPAFKIHTETLETSSPAPCSTVNANLMNSRKGAFHRPPLGTKNANAPRKGERHGADEDTVLMSSPKPKKIKNKPQRGEDESGELKPSLVEDRQYRRKDSEQQHLQTDLSDSRMPWDSPLNTPVSSIIVGPIPTLVVTAPSTSDTTRTTDESDDDFAVTDSLKQEEPYPISLSVDSTRLSEIAPAIESSPKSTTPPSNLIPQDTPQTNHVVDQDPFASATKGALHRGKHSLTPFRNDLLAVSGLDETEIQDVDDQMEVEMAKEATNEASSPKALLHPTQLLVVDDEDDHQADELSSDPIMDVDIEEHGTLGSADMDLDDDISLLEAWTGQQSALSSPTQAFVSPKPQSFKLRKKLHNVKPHNVWGPEISKTKLSDSKVSSSKSAQNDSSQEKRARPPKRSLLASLKGPGGIPSWELEKLKVKEDDDDGEDDEDEQYAVVADRPKRSRNRPGDWWVLPGIGDAPVKEKGGRRRETDGTKVRRAKKTVTFACDESFEEKGGNPKEVKRSNRKRSKPKVTNALTVASKTFKSNPKSKSKSKAGSAVPANTSSSQQIRVSKQKSSEERETKGSDSDVNGSEEDFDGWDTSAPQASFDLSSRLSNAMFGRGRGGNKRVRMSEIDSPDEGSSSGFERM